MSISEFRVDHRKVCIDNDNPPRPRYHSDGLDEVGGGRERQAINQSYRALMLDALRCVALCRRQKASRVWCAHKAGRKGNKISKPFPSSPAQRRPHRLRFPPLFNTTSRIALVSTHGLTASLRGAAQAWPAA